jgi:hypothetical protein
MSMGGKFSSHRYFAFFLRYRLLLLLLLLSLFLLLLLLSLFLLLLSIDDEMSESEEGSGCRTV